MRCLGNWKRSSFNTLKKEKTVRTIVAVVALIIALTNAALAEIPKAPGCPETYTLVVKVWEHKALSMPGVEQTHKAEQGEHNFVGTEHVSRKHGAQFRAAHARGELAESSVPRRFRVSLINTPQDRTGETRIDREEEVGIVTITGSKELLFKAQQLKDWDAIRIIALDDDGIASPPIFAGTGRHEMRFFNKLKGASQGEWDNPLEKQCLKREHWIETLPSVVVRWTFGNLALM
jgi:hypothetical protein